MLVEAIMTEDLVTCSTAASLRDGVERMLRNRVGSVIVHEKGTPTGIVTETDALHAGYVTERPFGEIPIRKVMSSPLVTIEPETTIRSATQRMGEKEVKKLVVVSDMDLVGVLTTQDIVDNYDQLKADITELVRPNKRREFDSRSFDLD